MLSAIFPRRLFRVAISSAENRYLWNLLGSNVFSDTALNRSWERLRQENKILVDLIPDCINLAHQENGNFLTFKQWAKIFLGTLYIW